LSPIGRSPFEIEVARVRKARMLLAIVGCALTATARLAAQDTTATPPPSAPQLPADAPAQGPEAAGPLARKVSLELRNVRLGDALKEIDRQAQLGLAYSPRVVPLDRRVTIKASDITAGEALQRALEGTGVEVQVGQTGTVFLVKPEPSSDRAGVRGVGAIGGQVLDSATHERLEEVQVVLQNTSFAAVTNSYGIYNLVNIPAGRYTIIARRIGYAAATKTVTVTDSARTDLIFALTAKPTRLTELVTTATGSKRRLELGNDIAVIDADSVVRTQPVRSVTDLLDGRVPGLVVQRTSGAPGDPGRIRLRGSSGVLTNNDPIVIVDGVRIYSQQSNARGGNLTNNGVNSFAAPSPLDQIPVQSIETVEVLKGPSAATLYGADAANGVIVITTKRGKAGPAQWSLSADRSTTFIPGRFADNFLRFGHLPTDGTPLACELTDVGFSPTERVASSCVADSLVRFQALNDPALTILDHGARTAGTLGVTGGSETVQYAVTGTYENIQGPVRLPDLEVTRYQLTHQGGPLPDWLQRPEHYQNWGVTSRLTARVSSKADVAISAVLTRGDQQRSSLESQILGVMGTYVDRTTGQYFGPNPNNGVLQPQDGFLTNYYTRVTDNATNFTNGLTFNWRPLTWLTASADAGINVIHREDALLLPRGAVLTNNDSTGHAADGRATSIVSTVNARATSTVPVGWGFRLQTSVGANYTDQRIADLIADAHDIPLGGTSVGTRNSGNTVVTESSAQQATFGWYVEPTLASQRFWLSLGLRLDGGNAFGGGVRLVSQPKVSPSWLISDEPWFPFKSVFNTLRLRGAYGRAGVQPGPADRLRLFNSPVVNPVDGQPGSTTTLQTFGNTQLRPERSTEFEGGFDADLFSDRVTLSVTGYRKTRDDALLEVPVPPSVYGGGTVIKNIGVIRNTGFELSLGSQVVRSDPVTWSMQLGFSHNKNMVVSLAPGVSAFTTDFFTGSRIVPGFPLNGKWGRPVVGYADLNGDGVLVSSEVVYGDSLVYLGPSEPDYTAQMSTTFSLFRGAVAISGDFQLQNGLTQTGSFSQLLAFSRGANDPTAPLGDQARVLATLAGNGGENFLNSQRVRMLRFNSLSATYNVPRHLAQSLGARALSLSLQGTNLGLFTNYRGKDPGVNGAITGDLVRDTGVLPQPRTWQVRINASY
jgi:TonB-linked SusC/RagA family outer membrane protein